MANLERKSHASGIKFVIFRKLTPVSLNQSQTSVDLQNSWEVLSLRTLRSQTYRIYKRLLTSDHNRIHLYFRERKVPAVKNFNKSKQKGEKLNTGHLKVNGPTRSVFICETLTKKSHKLFYLARAFRKEQGFDFCWTSRGVVYLRAPVNCPQIKIECEADLERLRA